VRLSSTAISATVRLSIRAPRIPPRDGAVGSLRPLLQEQTMASARETRNSIEDVGEEIAGAARSSAESAKSEFGKLGAKLRANGARLEEELHDARERIGEGARQFGDAAAEQIRAHPLAAFGIAFAAGVLISRVLRGR
jgi:ElaB/YqjD/DUF883 family membrane-anchored ribosome-binding protein